MNEMQRREEQARREIEDLAVVYLPVQSKFDELKELLSNLEDSIVMLPILGITQDYDSIMRDKMIMYETQIDAFRALYSYLNQHVIGPNDQSIITRRGESNLKEEQ